MNASELRQKGASGVDLELSQLLKAHFSLRMQKGSQQLTDHTQLGKTRRAIARAKTVLQELKNEQGVLK